LQNANQLRNSGSRFCVLEFWVQVRHGSRFSLQIYDVRMAHTAFTQLRES